MSYQHDKRAAIKDGDSDNEGAAEVRARRRADKALSKQQATLKSLRMDRRSPREIVEALANED